MNFREEKARAFPEEISSACRMRSFIIVAIRNIHFYKFTAETVVIVADADRSY